MYLCNHLKLCRVSHVCGRDCVLCNDKEHEMIPRAGQYIVVNNVNELNWWTDNLRETDLQFKVEGFKIIFV